jgi:hypothetical protein
MKQPSEHLEAAERALDEVHRLEADPGERDNMRRWHHMELADVHIKLALAMVAIEAENRT